MKNKQLAPGDSTVVELTFKTRTYKTKISKAATIYTNDLTESQVKIRVSANVDPVPDSTLPYTYTPNRLEFTPDNRKLEVVLTNTSKQTLNLTQVGDTYDDLSMKLGKDSLEPEKQTEIEFEWTGGFGKENFERSIVSLHLRRQDDVSGKPVGWAMPTETFLTLDTMQLVGVLLVKQGPPYSGRPPPEGPAPGGPPRDRPPPWP